MSTKVKVRETNNTRPVEVPKYHTQRMANYEKLYRWVKEAMIIRKGDININVNDADFIATYINNQLPDEVELAPTLSPRELMEYKPGDQPRPKVKQKVKAAFTLLLFFVLVCIFFWLVAS